MRILFIDSSSVIQQGDKKFVSVTSESKADLFNPCCDSCGTMISFDPPEFFTIRATCSFCGFDQEFYFHGGMWIPIF